MTDLTPFLVGAAVVAIVHMSAPDHWVTLVLLGKASCWSSNKLFWVSITTALGHAVLSAVLGLVIAFIGVFFSTLISFYLSLIIGALMLALGLFIGFRAVFSHKKREVTPEDKLLERAKNTSTFTGISYFAVLGAALSPDLSITPVFLSSIPVGLSFAVYIFIVFVVLSIISQVVLVQF